jgi:hypothetical protein
LASNTSASLQTTLAVDAHLAEGQILREEQTLNNANNNNNNNNSIPYYLCAKSTATRQ